MIRRKVNDGRERERENSQSIFLPATSTLGEKERERWERGNYSVMCYLD